MSRPPPGRAGISRRSYYRLGRNAQGGLERNSAAGRLMILPPNPADGTPAVQVNFGLTTSLPVVTTDPVYLIIDDFGVREYRYIAVE